MAGELSRNGGKQSLHLKTNKKHKRNCQGGGSEAMKEELARDLFLMFRISHAQFFQGKSGICEINYNFSLNALCSRDKIQVV